MHSKRVWLVGGESPRWLSACKAAVRCKGRASGGAAKREQGPLGRACICGLDCVSTPATCSGASWKAAHIRCMRGLGTGQGPTWKSSLMRSRGAVAVRATAPAAPPATNILRAARVACMGRPCSTCTLVHVVGSDLLPVLNAANSPVAFPVLLLKQRLAENARA